MNIDRPTEEPRMYDTLNSARAAAAWWAKQIKVIVPTPAGGTDRPTVEPLSRHAAALAAFKHALAAQITELVRRAGNAMIGVDYGPDAHLSQAADAAAAHGVTVVRYPIKARTEITHDRITAQLEYGEPFQTIWREGHEPEEN